MAVPRPAFVQMFQLAAAAVETLHLRPLAVAAEILRLRPLVVEIGMFLLRREEGGAVFLRDLARILQEAR